MKKKYIKIMFLLLISLIQNKTIAYSHITQKKEIKNDIYYYNEYIKTQKLLKQKKYENAINKLKNLDHEYYKEIYTEQTKINLIYAYYKNKKLKKAQSMIKKFLKLYPKYENKDYLIYINGVINMEISYKKFNNSFILNINEKDMSLMKIARKNFLNIIKKYPNSIYKKDSEKRLIYIKNQLAKNELLITKFYFNKKKWTIVINRIKHMIYNYPDTKYTKDALTLIHYALTKKKLLKETNLIKKIIDINK
ncbi:outer membrane protein assembly factor BamD [Candidatus Purcelliella pentastirinorum]|uniref:Outer membrane protein assembly factor BamD n=1 Tax=Candidatus Purcelliella pentastirinorum TaxID=472834 RepID=A0AAX3N7H3_9ENTR|nr:outer membrane protein assembly factor BamD [Candidatus Purcelliella pentastirinorum]WDI78446.1 outer membrane protein assembly factor BamD [Candidatus Purcelliella pentastirinorum]WDR80525.1 outer membrane protein assembly factor BamD [Candidatus Purcelliella pentastirinorum]